MFKEIFRKISERFLVSNQSDELMEYIKNIQEGKNPQIKGGIPDIEFYGKKGKIETARLRFDRGKFEESIFISRNRKSGEVKINKGIYPKINNK